jgi:deoxycytidine triphosphate deaminase
MTNPIVEQVALAKILADKDIRKLLGTAIANADPNRINPNGIEIRLGAHVLFQSTDEEKELAPGMFLKVAPGESVIISSYERFDFTSGTIGKLFPRCNVMAIITPTTTMMREGIMQSTTKVDSGWVGTLNWGLRNSSIRDFVLGYAEPIFKLTLFLLEGDEVPSVEYGDTANGRYQNTDGIARSSRTIPVSISPKNVVSSTSEKIDPRKQLREAGYPFSHISQELTDLHGKFEVVSKDVLLLKGAITDETKKLSDKVDQSQITVLEKVEALFDRKFLQVAGAVVGCLSIMYGGINLLKGQGVTGNALGWVGIAGGFGVFVVIYLLSRPKHAGPS